MTFWILATLVALSVAALLGLALLRHRQSSTEPAAAYDLRVYRAQLDEVERDLARGVVSPEDGERLRTEIARRILAADAQIKAAASGDAQPRGISRGMVLIMSAAIVAGSAALYAHLGSAGYGDLPLQARMAAAEDRAKNRPSQQEAEADVPALPAPNVSPDYLNLVAQLRSTMEKRPEDPRGFQLLSEHEANLGNFKDAYEAKQRYIDLQNGDVDGRDFMDTAELMVLAAGGYVSPEAEQLIRRVLFAEGENGTARYYFGLLMGQIGRPDQGYSVWADTLKRGPAGAPWIRRIEAQMPEMAALAGVNYTSITPPASSVAPAAPFASAGPSQDDIDAAADMAPEDRMAMIQGMVQQLSDRLATEGGSAQDWARLIASLGVLGQKERAAAILTEARGQFASNAEAMALLSAAAKSAGLSE